MATRKIFLDASVLYAFIDRADKNHQEAVRTFEQLSKRSTALYTSIMAVQDTHGAINNQLGVSLGLDFLLTLSESSIEVLYPQKSDFLSASRLIKANRNRQISLKEALNATLMAKKGISSILTFTYWHNPSRYPTSQFGFIGII